LNTLNYTEETIDEAFNRLKTFVDINSQREKDTKVEGLLAYCESVGLTEANTKYLYTKLLPHWGNTSPKVFVGVILGLRIALEAENE
jgi:hypothetical protein